LKLCIATCRPLPEPDVDEALLLDALSARGVDARMAAWNDPAERWDEPAATLVRSTWDYIHRLDAFFEWIARAARAGPLWNPAHVLRANAHKSYLFDLQRRGVPVVPTVLARGAKARLAEVLQARHWDEVVIKPAVGAGSFATQRASRKRLAEGEAHFAKLLGACDVLVQPYMRSVESHGERALVWIDGEFTHAVRKTPRFEDQSESVSDALPIERDELAVGIAALAPLAHELVYARVDVARDEHGQPLVMELELIEPSLFLRQSPAALERLVDAVARRLK
jgi:glutathione synthase/RimK-type ligase-like ATP-grasp enzyme